MRLDKFLGKADGDLKARVEDEISGERIFCMTDWYDYSILKSEMKNYKVVYYDTDHDGLLVYVKKKED
jgi:hypothetical protein